MEPTACNFCPTCQASCDDCCDFSSCVGCCDPADPNYCPECTQCNDNYCIQGIFDCINNRDIYVYYF